MRGDGFRGAPLGLLCLCLSFDEQGDDDLLRRLSAADTGWPLLLRAAGDHLVTPSLAFVLQQRKILARLDPEVRDYLEGIQSLNLIHNDALRGALFTVARELNGIGITPLVVKGAVALLPEQYPGSEHRVMGDLDIVVPDERLPEAHALLTRMGYSEDANTHDWRTAVEKRHFHHLPPMQHHSLPVSIELHRRMAFDPGDDSALRGACTPQPVMLDGGIHVSVPDPASRLVHSFIHSQISDRLGIRRLISLRHLHEFASLARQYRDHIDGESICRRLRPQRHAQFADYAAIAEAWLSAPFPDGLARSAGEGSAIWLTERVMSRVGWRKAFAAWCSLANAPRRLVKAGARMVEKPSYSLHLLKQAAAALQR